MYYKTAPQYPGSSDDFEKKKTYLFIATLVLMGIVYALVSPILENSRLFGAIILVPAYLAIFALNVKIDKWLQNDYSEKRRVWCDFWEAFDQELKQKKREYSHKSDARHRERSMASITVHLRSPFQLFSSRFCFPKRFGWQPAGCRSLRSARRWIQCGSGWDGS